MITGEVFFNQFLNGINKNQSMTKIMNDGMINMHQYIEKRNVTNNSNWISMIFHEKRIVVSKQFTNMLYGLLQPDPKKRITIHDFYHTSKFLVNDLSSIPRTKGYLTKYYDWLPHEICEGI